MKIQNMCDKLTVYIEASEYRSLFDNILDENININVTTAANRYESSWANYYSPDDVADEKHIGSCIGDEY